MSSERIDVPSKSLYVREVPDQPAHIAHPDFDNSDRSGFSNSTIDRSAYPFADRPNTRDFDAMLAAYLWSGGIARHQEVITRLEEDGNGGASNLSKLIDSRAVFAFDWRGSLWLPMFQFKHVDIFRYCDINLVIVKTADFVFSLLGVSKRNRGYRRGYKFVFDFIKPSIHASFKPSFKRFHTRFHEG